MLNSDWQRLDSPVGRRNENSTMELPLPQIAPIALVTAALVLFLVVVAGTRRLAAVLSQGQTGPRISPYLATAVSAWALAGLVVVAIWFIDQNEPVPNFVGALVDTGVNLHGGFSTGSLAAGWMFVTAVVVSNLVQVLRRSSGSGPSDAALNLLPRTPMEIAVWTLVLAPTAGLTEEFVYRGYLMSQVWGFVGNGWIAAAITSVVFGFVHGYQGAWGILRTGLIGFVLAVGVLATWSLVPSMIAHILLNAFGVAFNPPARRG